MKEIKNFNTFEVHRKIQVLGRVGWGGVGGGGSRKTNIYGGIRKKEGVMFFEGGWGGGGLIPQCTLCSEAETQSLLILKGGYR